MSFLKENDLGQKHLFAPITISPYKGVMRSDTLTYPKLEALYQAGFVRFWRPETLGLGMETDAQNFKNLPEPVKEIFTTNLQWQIAADTLNADGLEESLLPRINNIELKRCVRWQIMEEQTHSDSYNYIVNNMYDDPVSVNDGVLNNPLIADRISEYTRTYEAVDNDDNMFHTLSSIIALESVSFVTSFLVTLGINSEFNNALAASAKQITKIAVDEGKHQALFTYAIRQHMSSLSEKKDLEDFDKAMADTFKRVVADEIKFAESLYNIYPLPQLEPDKFKEFIEYKANKALVGAGFNEAFNNVGKPNLASWYQKTINIDDATVAPQEVDSASYRHNVLTNNKGWYAEEDTSVKFDNEESSKLEDLVSVESSIIKKRDGSIESYDPDKMKKFLDWSCRDFGMNSQTLLKEISVPKGKPVTTDKLMEICYKRAADLSSRITPQWLKVAGRIYALRKMKQNKENGFHFDPLTADKSKLASRYVTVLYETVYGLQEYIEREGKIGELLELTSLPKEWKNYTRPINSIMVFCEKQGMTFTKNGKTYTELPSATMLRQALGNPTKDGDFDLDHAKIVYEMLESAFYTKASPDAYHSGKKYAVKGSCTLLSTGDSTHSITDTDTSLAYHSKHGSGNGIDISSVAGAGRVISTTKGMSQGCKPFLKKFESTLSSFNQSGKRIGAGVVTFRWWHIDYDTLIALKSKTGTVEQRVRGLKYALVINEYLLEKAKNDEYVYLVCPHVAKTFLGSNVLVESYGKQFEEAYEKVVEAIKNKTIKGKRVKARYIIHEFLKYRFDHGNLYATFIDNINSSNMLKINVYSSNLCTEVLIPSRFLETK